MGLTAVGICPLLAYVSDAGLCRLHRSFPLRCSGWSRLLEVSETFYET